MGFELFEYEILIVTPYYQSSRILRPLLMSAKEVLSERGEKRFFYCKLDKRLNSLLCPPEALVIKDNIGHSYICKNKLVGTTSIVEYSSGGSISCEPKGIEGFEQGVIDTEIRTSWPKEIRKVIIIGVSEAFSGITIYKINTVHKIPIEHLQSIISFEVSPGESALN